MPQPMNIHLEVAYQQALSEIGFHKEESLRHAEMYFRLKQVVIAGGPELEELRARLKEQAGMAKPPSVPEKAEDQEQ